MKSKSNLYLLVTLLTVAFISFFLFLEVELFFFLIVFFLYLMSIGWALSTIEKMDTTVVGPPNPNVREGDLEFLLQIKSILEPTDPDRWIPYLRSDGNGNHCALGWLDAYNGGGSLLGLSQRLIHISNRLIKGNEYDVYDCPIVKANNGCSIKYPQHDIKTRVMACLDDLIQIAKS